jgi:hypothetical protein
MKIENFTIEEQRLISNICALTIDEIVRASKAVGLAFDTYPKTSLQSQAKENIYAGRNHMMGKNKK